MISQKLEADIKQLVREANETPAVRILRTAIEHAPVSAEIRAMKQRLVGARLAPVLRDAAIYLQVVRHNRIDGMVCRPSTATDGTPLLRRVRQDRR